MTEIIRVLIPVVETVHVVTSGPQGPSPSVSVYKEADITLSSGVLSIDFKDATTFFVAMSRNVTSVAAVNVPPGKSQRVVLYLIQDSTGSRTISGWPTGTKFPSGIAPTLSPAPNAIDQLVIDSSGGTFFVALAALDYRSP